MDRINAQHLLRGGDKHYLAVPFSEKDEAKSRGARWDGNTRSWYVPPRTSLYGYGKWLVGEYRVAFDFLEAEREAERLAREKWQALPPRSTDPAQIVRLAGLPIFRFNGPGAGRCAMCDSHLSTPWVVAIGAGAIMEHFHLADQVGKMLRPAEFAILERALWDGFDPGA